MTVRALGVPWCPWDRPLSQDSKEGPNVGIWVG